MRSSVSLFIRNLESGPVWYARFLNPATNQYEVTKSTGIEARGKKGRQQEAYNVALSMLEDISFVDYSSLITYLKDFWKVDSAYCKYRSLVEGNPHSTYYLQMNRMGIEQFIEIYPPFKNLRISELTAAMVNDWKLWLIEKGVGKRRINTLLQTLKTPYSYAYSRDEIPENPLVKISPIHYKEKERGVLDVDETEALLAVHENDPRIKSAVLLAAFCGLRRGEVRGLLWGDIDFEKGLIDVQHNWIDKQGLVRCKAGSERQTILHSSLLPILFHL